MPLLQHEMKIIGVGLNKTGTKTLGACLRHWGFKHISFSVRAFSLFKRSDFLGLFKVIRKYDSFEDWPWPLIFREIDGEFPESRFILTLRESPEVWFRSLCNHAKRTGPTEFRTHIYGYAMPHHHKSEHIRFYENHNRAVQEFFQGRPEKLLTVCWENGEGWKPLVDFLGLPAPDTPFPHENKNQT
jgi:hypothetical protein